MADRKFAHLHLHTHYSMLDGFNRIPAVVEQTKKLGMCACAITDHGNLYGAVEFHTECRKAGVLQLRLPLQARLRDECKGQHGRDRDTGCPSHRQL